MTSSYCFYKTLIGHDNAINSIIFNSTGTYMASGGDDGTINVWQVTKSCDFKHTQSIAEPYDRWGQICVIIFQSPRGSAGYPIETIIAGTGEGHILQWREDRTQGVFEEIHGSAHFSDPVESIAVNSSDCLVASSHSGKIECWDISGTEWTSLWNRQMVEGIPRAVSFDNTGAIIYLFSLERGDRFTLSPDTGRIKERRQLKGPVGNVDMSPHSSKFVVDTICGDYKIYDTRTSSPSITLARPHGSLNTNYMVKQAVFGENSTVVVCGSSIDQVYIYDLTQESPILPLQILHHDKGPVQTVATFSFADRHIIAASVTEDHSSIRIWSRSRIVPQEMPLGEPKPKPKPKPKRTPAPAPGSGSGSAHAHAPTPAPAPTRDEAQNQENTASMLFLILAIALWCVWYFDEAWDTVLGTVTGKDDFATFFEGQDAQH